MRKLLAVLSIVAVLFLGIVGALAVVPHTHGNDYNHSKHENCPVYQFGVQKVHATEAAAVVFSLVFVLQFILFQENHSFLGIHHLFSYLRGPPALV